MNASYDWLKAFVSFDESPAELRDLITSRCATVDEMLSLRSDLDEIVIGYVVEAARHPNSDHLWLTKVDAGTGELLDVVCGAPNVKAGKRYPFAPVGATLPGGLKLEKRKIRGAISNGMLCSSRELHLGDDHEGILELNTDSAPGASFVAALGVGDTRFVIDVLPNRSDLLSHLGLAREISAATGQAMSWPELPDVSETPLHAPRSSTSNRAGRVEVRLDDSAGAPRYMGVVVRGVRVAASPAWLTARLESVGARSVNNIVDATNYMLHELGQPMHAFDVAKLAGSALVVRRARGGERLRTLDGVERVLGAEMTVIADAERAQAVAGVMGGGESEVTEATTDIFLEVATFDPVSVRATRRALGLSTDASYRFERGTDIELPPAALARAVALIRSVAGGEVEGAAVDLYPAPRERTESALRVLRVHQLLGESIPAAEIARLLESVGFRGAENEDKTSLQIAIPSWRVDVRAEVDLIEEVARLRGYDSFPDDLRPFRPGTVPTASLDITCKRLREALVARGLLETRPMPFVSGAKKGFVRVANPIADNEAYLRRDLLDTLSRRAEHNLSQMQRNIRLFEIGTVFEPAAGSAPREEMRVAALIMGDRRPPHWSDPPSPAFDVWDAKALGEEMARVIAPGQVRALRAGKGDQLWAVDIEGTTRGEIRKVRLDAPVWAAEAFGVEMTVQRMSAEPVAPPRTTRYDAATGDDRQAAGATRYKELPSTPSSSIDVALLVPNDMPAARVEELILRAMGPLLEDLTLLSEYRGETVAPEARSIAWRLVFRHPERTLESREIAVRRERLLRTLEGELGVRERTA